MTTVPQAAQRDAGTDETTGSVAAPPKIRRPEENARHTIRRHPRGRAECHTVPEHELR